MAAVAGGWQLWLRRPKSLAFRPIERLPGWEVAETGEISGSAAGAVFVGLDQAAPQEPLPVADLHDVLFSDGKPLAVLTDVRCPYCRRIVPGMAEAFGERIAWHALPLLGRVSEIAAKAAVAAELQGGATAMHVRLHALPIRPSPAWFGALASEVGLDGDRLIRDMEGQVVANRLSNTRRAAERLGVYGTPALAVPGKLIIGAFSIRDAENLVASA